MEVGGDRTCISGRGSWAPLRWDYAGDGNGMPGTPDLRMVHLAKLVSARMIWVRVEACHLAMLCETAMWAYMCVIYHMGKASNRKIIQQFVAY